MNLLLLTFGERLENHYQAAFSLITYLKDPCISNAIVVTDRPDFYSFFSGKVDVIHINSTLLKEWEGEYEFFWRVKIKALELVLQKYPKEHLIYVDSDTFLATNLSEMNLGLNEGISYMHIHENKISDNKKSHTLRKMYKSLIGKTFAGVTITDYSSMWNAGVIALPSSKAKEIIDLTLAVCDGICATDCERRLVEQFSFSVALSHLSNLQPCSNYIAHYWGNKKEWNSFISDFFVNACLKNFKLEDCVEEASKISYNIIPIRKKYSNTRDKLIDLINKLFPPKIVRYFNPT